MKKLLIAMLVLTFILATAAVALAGTGRFGNQQDGSAGDNYTSYANLDAARKSGGVPGDPHGGYAANTNMCSFCHAVHNAGTDRNGANVWKLVRTTASGGVLGACEYCHTNGAISVKQPYETGAWTERARHTLGSTVIPDAADATRLGSNNLLDCKDCHEAAPHAANEIAAGKLIDASRTTITGLCASCHTKNNVGANFNQQSHPMVAASNGLGNGRTQAVVPNGTNTNNCKDCHTHKKADNSDADGLFPHVSSAPRFLNEKGGTLSADGSTGTLDAICLDCHGVGGTAVGVDF